MADTDDVLVDSGPTSSPQDAVLDSLSRSEDATAYIEQRQDDLREEAGLEPESSDADRESRIEQALARARQDTADARQTNGNGLDLDAQYRDAQAEWQAQQQAEQQAAQQQLATQRYYEARGQCMAQAQRLKEMHPQLHATITSNLTALGDVLTDEQGQALEHALVMYPQAVWTLAARLTDDRDGQTFGDKLEIVRNATPQQIFQAAQQGAVNLQNERYIQTRILQDRVAQGKRFTQAPPPITPPRGGAGVPKDMNQLAGKSDISDYVKWRRGQMARDERDR
jgi:hypothetical protein